MKFLENLKGIPHAEGDPLEHRTREMGPSVPRAHSHEGAPRVGVLVRGPLPHQVREE